MDDKVVDLEGFDPAGMTREELIETVVRLPDGREKRFGDFTQKDLELLREISEEGVRKGDDR